MLEKCKILLYLIFGYLGIDVEVFAILMVFMCLDSVLGAIKAIRLGERFKFKKMLWGFILKLCFLIVPLVLALLGKSLGYDFNLAVNITISILTVAEAYSIIGNIYSAKNKIKIEKTDAISVMLLNIRKVIKKILDLLMKKFET
jgi:small basic protein